MTDVAEIPQTPSVPGRWRAFGAACWSALTHAPLTLGCVLVLWLLGLVTGSLANGPTEWTIEHLGAGLQAFADGHWWAPLTSPLFCMNLAHYVTTTLLFLVIGVPAERRLGSARAALLMLVSQVGGCLLAIGIIWIGRHTEEQWLYGISNYNQFGPSPAVAGLGLALTYRLSTLWRRRVRLLFVGGLLMWALYVGDVIDLIRLCGGVVGLLAGLAMFGRAVRGRIGAPSHSETRVLVAMVVAGGALGALLTVAVDYAQGPLSYWRELLVAPVYTMLPPSGTLDDAERARLVASASSPTVTDALVLLPSAS